MNAKAVKQRGRCAIRLVETRRNCAMLEETPRYAVMFDGEEFDELYFNLIGYVGYLPAPGGGRLMIGEQPISAYRREVAKLNSEFRAIRSS